MREEDQLQLQLLDWEGEGGSVGKQPDRARESPPPAIAVEPARNLGALGTLDPRHRRGSLGPAPAAAPLGDNASPSALHAHLVHLLDNGREATIDPVADAAQHEAEAAAESPASREASLRLMASVVELPFELAEQRLTPHEDIERQPDGIPHLVIGLTALFSVLLAAVLISIFRSGPTMGSIAAVVLAIIGLPIMVSKLGAKAERDRDHVHPSR